MGRRRSGYITIDCSEVLDNIDDDELLDEVHARKLSPALPGETCDFDIVREAYEAIMRGRVIEAKNILDRLLFPKWKSPKDCQQQYEKML